MEQGKRTVEWQIRLYGGKPNAFLSEDYVWSLYYDFTLGAVCPFFGRPSPSGYFFDSKEAAQNAIDEITEEELKAYFFQVNGVQ